MNSLKPTCSLLGVLLLGACLSVGGTDGGDGKFLMDHKAREFWSFQPLSNPQLPEVADELWIRNPLDRFVLAKLEDAGLSPSPPAEKHQLIRRVSFHLTGLPPTPEEIDEFVNDDSTGAFCKVVERLLGSPHYGERWGRHWLDIARYGESAGHDGNNAYIYAWQYRDYIIRSFNKDKPYDQFIIEQLAGDLLRKTGDPRQDFDQVVATGFLQVGPKPVVMRDKKQMLLDIADEQLHTTGVAFMAITLGCARCHDHKFDPIPTKDYYSMAGFFMNTHVMFDHAPDSMWLQPLVKDSKGKEVKVMAVRDFPKEKIAELRIHERGNYRTLGEEAPRGFLRIIAGKKHSPVKTTGSGRLELARWIASPGHPLTARVMVNRIWQHHFGRGLVTTSDDFGSRGDKPSHPELLDLLARRFIESGWSIKEMHRFIVLSSVYQQSSSADVQAAKLDPANRLLWRMQRRRLDAEEIRDAILAGSGKLDTKLGGNLFISGYKFNDPKRDLPVVEHISVDAFGPFQAPRRSVYMPVIRNVIHPMLRLFDTANEHESSPTRHQTTVAPQALFMINSPFVRRLATGLARDLFAKKKASFEDRLQTAYLRLLGRSPGQDEIEGAKIYIARFVEQLGGAEPPPEDTMPNVNATQEKTTVPYAELIGKTRGLMAYYRFDPMKGEQGKSPSIINSVNPNLSPGELPKGAELGVPGAIIARGSANEINRAIRFNGTDQHVRIKDPAVANVTTGSLTVEYWINPAEVRLGFGVGRDSADERFWKSGIMPSPVSGEMKNVVFHEYFSGGGGFRKGNDELSVAEVGEWTHVVFTFGNGYRRLYVNGRQVDELAVGISLPVGNLPITFGARLNSNTEHLNGSLDEVAFYDRELEVKEVEDHFLAGGDKLHKREKQKTRFTREQKAWRSYCQALMCMNEFIYVD